MSYAVSSFKSQASARTKFVVIPGNKGVTGDDLEFQEYARYVARMLIAKGYAIVGSLMEADLVIMVGSQATFAVYRNALAPGI